MRGGLALVGSAAAPAELASVSAIASGTNFHLALLTNTTVVAWGANDAGQTTVPASLSNVVAIAAGGAHALALNSDGTVTGWGSDGAGESDSPPDLTNAMAIAAGAVHSVALRNDGTVVAWGDNTAGQTNLPAGWGAMKLIAAGGDSTLTGQFSPLVQYQVDATKDLLLVYNASSLDSSNLCMYYLAHRPMVWNANVLGVTCATGEFTWKADCDIQIVNPVLQWLGQNPTKHPQYVVLFYDIPTRLRDGDDECGSVSYHLYTSYPGWAPFVMNINGGTRADCEAYIDKLAYFGTTYSPGKLIISGSAGEYGNTNFVVDNVRYGAGYPIDFSKDGFYVSNATNGLLASGVSPQAIIYADGSETCSTNGTFNLPHITSATNVAGYICWGAHSSLGQTYAIDGTVNWTGSSRWWIIETVESFNGERAQWSPMGNFIQWLSGNAFGGSNYSNTPVGAATHVEEPYLPGVNTSGTYFGLWAGGRSFAICAWNSRNTPHFQAVGDPLVVK
jgi:hypothetical protein